MLVNNCHFDFARFISALTNDTFGLIKEHGFNMKRFVFLLMFLLGMNALAVEKPILEPASKKLVEQALAAEDAGDLRKAIALHKSVVAINPKNFISLNAIAGLYGVL